MRRPKKSLAYFTCHNQNKPNIECKKSDETQQIWYRSPEIRPQLHVRAIAPRLPAAMISILRPMKENNRVYFLEGKLNCTKCVKFRSEGILKLVQQLCFLFVCLFVPPFF